MICPHCGRNTKAAEFCQHCHEPTEFTPRFSSRPGPIPGIEDGQGSTLRENARGRKGRGALLPMVLCCMALSMITCALSALCLLQIGRLPGKEDLVPEATAAPAADALVCFDRNLPEEGEWIPPISRGAILPTLLNDEERLFIGWNTDPNGSGTSFCPGEVFDLDLTEDLTLFAQWVPVAKQTAPTAPETEPAMTAPDVLGPDIHSGGAVGEMPDPLPTQEREDNHE